LQAKKDIREWLISINCIKYMDLLIENGYDDLTFYHELTEEDLKEIGVDDAVDRMEVN